MINHGVVKEADRAQVGIEGSESAGREARVEAKAAAEVLFPADQDQHCFCPIDAAPVIKNSTRCELCTFAHMCGVG